MDEISKQTSFSKVILLTILLAGSLDITAAFIDSFIGHRINPVIVLQYIASAIFGQTAFTMGWFGGLAGLFFHYLIVAIWTLLFFLLYPKLKITSRYKSVAGLTLWHFHLDRDEFSSCAIIQHSEIPINPQSCIFRGTVCDVLCRLAGIAYVSPL